MAPPPIPAQNGKGKGRSATASEEEEEEYDGLKERRSPHFLLNRCSTGRIYEKVMADGWFVGEREEGGADDEEGRFFGGGLNTEQNVCTSSLS